MNQQLQECCHECDRGLGRHGTQTVSRSGRLKEIIDENKVINKIYQ